MFVYMLVLLERQTSKDLEPLQSNAVLEIGERWVAEYLFKCDRGGGVMAEAVSRQLLDDLSSPVSSLGQST